MPVDKLQQYLRLADDPAKGLGLALKGNSLAPGSFVAKADAHEAPRLSFGLADPSKTYVAVCLDPDAPFQSFAFLDPILHWIQPGFKYNDTNGAILKTSSATITEYIAPAPPTPSGPHRYVFLLYEQPTVFDAADHGAREGKASTWSRIRFDLDSWEKQAGLAAPVAVNFFTSK